MTDSPPQIWNPFQKGYRENPYEQLRLLRECNPVHKGINGRWMLLKYQDVKYLLTAPVFKTVKVSQAVKSKSKYLGERGDLSRLAETSAQWMLFFDPPEHGEMRSMVAKIWLKYDLTADVRAIVAENIEFLSGKNKIDAVADFAAYIPSKVICKILGLPPADYVKFREWSYCFNSMLEPFSTLHDFVYYNGKAQEFYEYLNAKIEEKTRAPDEAFISEFLIANEKLAAPLGRSEVISVIAFLFFAGIETSINLFGESVLLLLKNPQQAQLLREDETIAECAVEELLRCVSPSQYTTRVAAEDVEIRGRKISAGDFVMGATVSANRDEEVFEDAERLDLTRSENPHIAFGYGLHYCLGAKLARLETLHSLPALLKNFPDLALDPERPLEWDKIIINRGLKSLPVVLNR